MAIPGVPDIDTRYVTTYSYEGLDGYLVRVPTYPTRKSTEKRWHTKLFAFKKFPSTQEALLAAMAYRDQWFQEHAEDSRLRPVGAVFSVRLPSNNTSGIVGVNRTHRGTDSDPTEEAWQASFRGSDGKPCNRRFAVGRFGELGALRRAVEARRDGLLEYLTTVEEEHVDVNLDVIAFYDDILANLKDYSDQESSSPLLEIVRDPNLPATSKLDQLLVRVGQQRFRREVLEYFDNRCAITNSALLIRASHIKPWRVCNDEDRLNRYNGLALSPVYDAAFDLGLIAFSPDGRILVSPRFSDDAGRLGIDGSERLAKLGDQHQPYLAWHRERIFLASDG